MRAPAERPAGLLPVHWCPARPRCGRGRVHPAQLLNTASPGAGGDRSLRELRAVQERSSQMTAEAEDAVQELRQAEGSGQASASALAEDAVAWASMHGLVVGLGDAERPHALTHAPLAVVPVPFPRAAFQRAKAVMPLFNTLVDAVSRDGEYLQHVLVPAAAFDDFTVLPARLRLMAGMAP